MTASTANTPPPLAVTTTTTAASTMTTPPPLDTGPSATTPSCVPTILYSEFDVILVTVGGAKLNVCFLSPTDDDSRDSDARVVLISKKRES
eukprot:74893-Rhodomonas_salina.1